MQPRGRPIKQMLHPFAFLLKEGEKITQNYLDYSLLIVHVGCLETMVSPLKSGRIDTALQKPAIKMA